MAPRSVICDFDSAAYLYTTTVLQLQTMSHRIVRCVVVWMGHAYVGQCVEILGHFTTGGLAIVITIGYALSSFMTKDD